MDLEKILAKYKEFIVYAEFLGPNSFAGKHKPDDIKDLIIFDVNVHKKGFISPGDFIELFGRLDIPKLIYEGVLTKQFVENIRQNTELSEGVVIKGGTGHHIWRRKVKTLAYLDKLKKSFGDNWKQYWE